MAAALIEVRVSHGAAPGLGVDVTATTLRMKRADNDVQDANDPVPIPSAGVEFSFRKSLKLVAVTVPDNRISNLRFFSDGVSLGTGRTIFFARTGSYIQASAADLTGAISAVDVDTFTAATPEVIQAGTVFQNSDVPPTDGGVLQDFVMLQLQLDPTAIAGAPAAAKTLTWLYDET